MRRTLRSRIEVERRPVPLTTEGKLALAGLLVGAACADCFFGLRPPARAHPPARGPDRALVVVVRAIARIVASVARGRVLVGAAAGGRVVCDCRGAAEGGPAAALAARACGFWRSLSASAGENHLSLRSRAGVERNEQSAGGLISRAAIRDAARTRALLAHAVLLGVDLGPNLSVTGSLATILWLIALRRENVEITAWEFFESRPRSRCPWHCWRVSSSCC